MRTGNDRFVVAVAWTAVSARGGTRKAIGGFLRYVQYRDKHPEPEQPSGSQRRADGELRYFAHRDQAAGHGRLFDATGTVGDEERRALAAFVARAAASTKPQVWRDAGGVIRDRRRALYRFVISPERAPGLDLRRLTLAAVSQLESDAGGPLRWIAAEHRNTAHPHVHLIVAGFRETADGGIQGLVVNKPRLERLKGAVGREIDRERGTEQVVVVVHEPEPERTDPSPVTSVPEVERRSTPQPFPGERRSPRGLERQFTVALSNRPERVGRPRGLALRGTALLRMAARYRWQAEREAAGRDLGRELEAA